MQSTSRTDRRPRATRYPRQVVLGLGFVLLLAQIAALPAAAQAPGNDTFQRTWERTDRPVTDELVRRILM